MPLSPAGHSSSHQRLEITEWVRLGGATVDHLVQPPCTSRVTLEHRAQDCVQMVCEYPQ